MIEKGNKIRSEPRVYEIEILRIDKEIPKDKEDEFKQWLNNQFNECAPGKNHEYFSYSEDWKDDIGILFYMKSV